MKEMKIKVNGMVCEGCENRVKNALSTIEGVTKVQASHKEGIVIVTTSKDIQENVIKEKINDIGFEVIEEN